MTKLYNLSEGVSMTFALEPEEALVSAHIAEKRERMGRFHDEEYREKLKRYITTGKHSMALGNWCCLKP